MTGQATESASPTSGATPTPTPTSTSTPSTTRELRVPASSLVVLVGVSGSGKSTFAREHFGPYETVSSDVCRGLVSNDENDQAATRAAFEVLETIVSKRLEANLLTVVDATNVQREARGSLVALARAHDVLPVAIVLDVPEKVAVERNAARPDRGFGAHVVKRQRAALRSSLKSLQREGFRTVHVLRGEDEVAAAQVVRTPLLTDRRDEHGPFDAIGDVHGCLDELVALLGVLGYAVVRDDAGRPVDAVHPEGRRAIFLGDLVDRGPDSPGVLRLAMGMVRAGHALAVPGNHEHKLVRALGGRDVKVSHGLETTLAQLAAEPEEFRRGAEAFCRDLVSHLVLDDGRLVVAHAGLKESYQGRASGRVRSFALYGDTTGETDEFGLPVRYPWADDYRGRAMVLYGHTPTPEVEWVNGTMCLDTGCVFGGKLSALRYPEKEVVQVPAAREYYAPARPFLPDGATGPGSSARADDLLSVTDVLGRRGVETATHGRVTVGEEQAAGALEVMSRFAVDPRLLLHLPPTMSPVATSTLPGLLEHPDGAFAAYARDGVDRVVCEEKHMGSRAVLLVARDSGPGGSRVVAERFGIEAPGAVHTRTGRSFLDGPTTELLLARVAAAFDAAGTWDALGADWVLLDAEVLPWSLKADQLLRDQYASVGAAARAVMPAALAALAAAEARGVDVGELRRRTARRATGAELFVEAYRRYRWDTGAVGDGGGGGADPLHGVQVAPFQVLASGTAGRPGSPEVTGATHADRDHLWHLGVADALVAADPALFRATRRVVVDLADEASRAEGTAWWEELTAAGGEGMVVKPLANLVRRQGAPGKGGGLVQPGLKVRGREYLRIIYGPEYTEERNLERLRERSLGRKRSLALREYALGLEALDRVARGEPTWRVHEPVFAVLALESEPVDPRL
ncbi:polynucleotide kinase-phosphatase [Cellulosimicrobium funkei]|uniref:Polynucleotide kinase-phosphatase n=1 Tax=Cellulosimicrobium funkei TaxID=264251 RepID=A0A4Y8QZD0_9MICO|nr:polynucleotide kinase-phosphatase [Cellulosimicrobium funkei]TFF05152.1 polynucleotide kinase-phosphatase [Cellulosimicrobium funkei]TGA69547.1 polynucleotide kinase-phosphatase [Cellulosimicrobium terreum]